MIQVQLKNDQRRIFICVEKTDKSLFIIRALKYNSSKLTSEDIKFKRMAHSLLLRTDLFYYFSGIEDLQICRALLESKQWDLEATAREHLNIPSNEPPIQRPVMPSAPPEAPNARHVMRPQPRDNPRPLVPMGHTVFTWAWYLITLPFRLSYRTMFGVFDFVLSIFGFQDNSPNHRHRLLGTYVMYMHKKSKKSSLQENS